MAEMNAAEFQRELSDAIETKKLVEGALTEGGAVTGTITIGKQKFPL